MGKNARHRECHIRLYRHISLKPYPYGKSIEPLGHHYVLNTVNAELGLETPTTKVGFLVTTKARHL